MIEHSPFEDYDVKKIFSTDITDVISSPIMQKVYHIYDKISQSMRKLLSFEEEFLEFKPPLIGPVTDPGIRGAKQVELDYYGRKYKFMSSGILYKQLLSISRKNAGFPGKIYFFADNLRLEPVETSSTSRHLAEFIQVDLEIISEDHFAAMDIAERLLTRVHEDMKKEEHHLKDIWKFFERSYTDVGIKPRSEIKVPERFKRYTFKEAIDFITDKLDSHPEMIKHIEQKFKIKPKKLTYKAELPWEYEWVMSYFHDEPFFIHDYPKGARGFYDREYDDKPGILMDFDMLFPLGYGEAASGAAREYKIERIIPRMKESGEALQKYEWYLKFLKEHGQPTAGFGIGLERTVRYFCGLPSIALTLPYPKIPGIYSP